MVTDCNQLSTPHLTLSLPLEPVFGLSVLGFCRNMLVQEGVLNARNPWAMHKLCTCVFGSKPDDTLPFPLTGCGLHSPVICSDLVHLVAAERAGLASPLCRNVEVKDDAEWVWPLYWVQTKCANFCSSSSSLFSLSLSLSVCAHVWYLGSETCVHSLQVEV